MSRKFIFADEAGDFTFERRPNVSRYFILCTIAMEDDAALAAAILQHRRNLAWEGSQLGDYFHASTDKQAVRDSFYETLLKHPFTVQATIMEKSKAQPHVRESKPRFYKFSWYYHFKHGTKGEFTHKQDALITSACLGTKRERAAFQDAVHDVMRQTMRACEWHTDFMPAAADPCLQAADYCAWAIQRKWESENVDMRSYNLIQDRITYEYDLWEHGAHHYYH